MIAASRLAPGQALPAEAFTTLERRLVVGSNSPQVMDYLRSAFRRLRVDLPRHADDSHDSGCILADVGEPWLYFNGDPVEYAVEQPSTHFRLGFYGSSKLFRLSFRRNAGWQSMYAAGLRLGDRAIVISAQSGIGKTTLALELMARGARFYSDEFVFIRKSDRAVSGLPRGLMIRERTLSIVSDPRLKAVCDASAPRNTHHGARVWDNIDPADLFGESIFAQPAPLGAAIMLERSSGARIAVEGIPASLAAVNFAKGLNAQASGFERLTETAVMLDGIPCFRVESSSPQDAADAIEALLR